MSENSNQSETINDPPANDPKGSNPPANDPKGSNPPANDPPANDPPAEEINYEFKTPDDIALNEEALGKFTDVARELKIPADQAQKFVDIAIDLQKKWSDSQIEHWEGIKKEWYNQSKSDKEFGGNKFDENMKYVAKAREAVATPELIEIFEQTGYGNHPEVIRLFWKVGQAISEDNFNPSLSQESAEKSLADRLYNS